MKKITIIFWTIFWLFVYKLAFLQKDQPKTDRKFAIVRDQQGVPHVYAKNYKDLLFGLGYAEAQDRLFTMFFKKMLIQGRTSQLFGPDAVACDLQMRNLGLYETGKTNKLYTDPETLQLLQAYADGINSYAKSVKMLPFQFYLFWLQWQDWNVQDSLATINLLSFVLQFDWFYEIARQRLLETVGFDLARKIMSYGGNNLFRSTTIISDEELKELGKYQAYSFQNQTEVLKKHWASKNITLGSVHFPQIHAGLQGSGSNSWTIGKQHTFHGKPILANDPHVGTILPNMFYNFEIVLLRQNNTIKSRKFGVMPDGVPTVSLGVSQLAAWSATAAYIDNKDVYYETIRNNSGKMQYLFKDEWLDFRQRKETIKVRGGKDIQQIFYHTHRGVVIETIFMDIHWKYGYPLPSQYKDNHTLTLVATHFRPDNSSAKGLINLLTFETYQQFDQIRNHIKHPNIDGTCIFKNGSFAYYGVGGIPKREIPEMGSFIKDGNSDLYDMGEDLSREETLVVIDRKQGYVSMANNRFASDNYKYRSSLHQITTGRSYFLDKSIKEKIKRKEKFTFDDIKNLQLSQKDEFLAEVLPRFTSKLTQLRKVWSNPQTQILFEKLLNWDAIVSKDSVQASIYHVFQHLFQYSLFTLTDLSEFQRTSIVTHAFFQNFYFGLLQKFEKGKLTSEEKILCQSFQTKKYSNLHACEASIGLAFKKLPEQLNKLFGSDNVEDYVWGKIHRQTFKSVPFSDVPLLNHLWNRDFPVGGNSRTLNVAISAYQAKNYDSIGSAAFRLITDLNTTYYGIQAGQNDRIMSPHFDQFINKNVYLEYKPQNPFIEGLPLGWQFYVNLLE